MSHENEIMLWNIFEGRNNDKKKMFNIGKRRIQRIGIQLEHCQDVESLQFCFLLHQCNKSNHCFGIDLGHSHRWLRKSWCVGSKSGKGENLRYVDLKKTRWTYVWIVDKKLKLIDFASSWCSCCCRCCSGCRGGSCWSWCWSSWGSVAISVSAASATTAASTTTTASFNRNKDGCSKDSS